MNVGALNHKDSASNLQNITDPERMQGALLTLCAQSEPGSVGRSNICQVETLSLLLIWARWTNRRLVAYLCMIVAHLRVLLDTKCVLSVPSNRET